MQQLQADLGASPELAALGLEILGVSLLAIKPTPDSARALEAEAREQLLKEADEALYRRRNASIEQERAIKENELGTELAVELKKRQIRDAEIDTERSVLRNAVPCARPSSKPTSRSRKAAVNSSACARKISGRNPTPKPTGSTL